MSSSGSASGSGEPSALRHRVQALQIATVEVPGTPTVDAEVLTAVATACRDHQRLRFDYRDHRDAHSVRVTEPHKLVTWGRRWYLVAWNLERDDWRTFRVDRLGPRVPTGPRFAPRDLPGGDAAAFVARGVAQMWPYQATVRLHVPADAPAARRYATYGRIEPVDERTCLLHFGADTPHALAFLLGALEVDFDLQDAPALAEELLRLADRFRRVTEPAGRGQGASSTSTVPPVRQYTLSEREPDGAGSSARSRKPSSTR